MIVREKSKNVHFVGRFYANNRAKEVADMYMIPYRNQNRIVKPPKPGCLNNTLEYDKLLCERDELMMDKIDLENQILDLKRRLTDKHFENDVLQERVGKLDVLCNDIEELRMEHDKLQREMKEIEGKCVKEKRRLQKRLDIILSDINVAGMLCCVCQKSMSLFNCSQCRRNYCRVCYSSNDMCLYCNGTV